MTDPRREYERRREHLIRRATLYTAGFFGAAIAVAVGGAALVAWALSWFGLPFRVTWVVIAVPVLVVPFAGHALGALRRRRGSGGVGSEGADAERDMPGE